MEIQIQVNDQPVNAYLALPVTGSGPGVLLLHAWWGLKPFFKQTCDQLAAQGFVVLAPDLRDGKIALTVEEAQALMEQSDWQRMGDIVMAAKDFLRNHPARTGQKLGAIGFSMGAAWALIAASHAPEQFAATVAFYGSAAVDFSHMQAKFMGHFSDADPWEPMDSLNAMAFAMKTAGLETTIFLYPGLPHWFVEADRPEYEPASAQLAWERTFTFLKENLV